MISAGGAGETAGDSRGRGGGRWWLSLVLVVLAVVILNAAAWMTQQASRDRTRLPGISVVRPPGEVSALVLEGSMLIAGGKDGLWAIDTETLEVTPLQRAGSLEPGHVRALLLDPDGTLWVGHERGLARMDGDSLREYAADDGLPSARVQSLLRTGEGDLVAGTSLGAAVMRAGSDVFEPLAADGFIVFALHETDGALLLGTSNAPRGGLVVLADGETTWMTPDDGLPHANVTSFCDADDGTIWVGTGFHDRGGAVRLRFDAERIPAVVEALGVDDGLAGAKVRSVFRDGDGALWFGSEYDGVTVVSPGSSAAGRAPTVVRADQGLSNREVKCFAQDAKGRLWMGTMDGITLVDDPGSIAGR